MSIFLAPPSPMRLSFACRCPCKMGLAMPPHSPRTRELLRGGTLGAASLIGQKKKVVQGNAHSDVDTSIVTHTSVVNALARGRLLRLCALLQTVTRRRP